MQILITGASGFCGGCITADLVRRHHVTAVSRRPRPPGLTSSVHWIQSDLLSLGELPANLDLVVHTAGCAMHAKATIEEYVRDNVLATAHLMKLAARFEAARMLFFSTVSIYGEVTASHVSEETPVVNPSPYGASKLLGEAAVAALADQVPAVAIRLPGVLGPGATRHWLAGVRERAIVGREIPVFNPDGTFNNAVHVADLTRFAEDLATRNWTGAHVLTLSAASTLTTRQVVERVVAAAGSTSPIVERPALKPSFLISSRRAMDRWGYAPMALDTMLDRYVAENMPGATAPVNDPGEVSSGREVT